jgi:hypothetical protein
MKLKKGNYVFITNRDTYGKIVEVKDKQYLVELPTGEEILIAGEFLVKVVLLLNRLVPLIKLLINNIRNLKRKK